MAKNLGITKGSTLGNCHIVEDIIGEGGFGVVAKCRNTDTNKTVAVKINKSEAGILQQAVEEIAILKRLRCLSPDTCNIVRWDGFFFHKENICMTFELLDQSLYHYLQEQHTRGLTMGKLKPILHQLATALAHLHSIEIVHADLKPVNVMVVNRHQHPIQVKLIDFGLACPVSEVKQGACFGTFWYSAPEMLLGVPFKESFDMWSLGLIMAELILGCHLYPGKTAYDVLRFMVETQGQPPDEVLDQGLYTEKYFFKRNNRTPRWTFKSPDDMYYQYGFYASETRDIKLKSLDEIEQYMEQDVELEKDRKMLVSLIKSMLNMDASKRITAREVLQHPFFDLSIPESSSANAGEIVAHTENQERNTSPSMSAASWNEALNFNPQSLAQLSSAASLEVCVGLSAQRLASSPTDMSWEEKIETNSQPEHVVTDIVESTPSLTAVSRDDCPTETSKKNISWWRRIMRRITRAFHRIS